MNYWHNFEDHSKKRKNNNQTHRGRPPGVAEDGGAKESLILLRCTTVPGTWGT